MENIARATQSYALSAAGLRAKRSPTSSRWLEAAFKGAANPGFAGQTQWCGRGPRPGRQESEGLSVCWEGLHDDERLIEALIELCRSGAGGWPCRGAARAEAIGAPSFGLEVYLVRRGTRDSRRLSGATALCWSKARGRWQTSLLARGLEEAREQYSVAFTDFRSTRPIWNP